MAVLRLLSDCYHPINIGTGAREVYNVHYHTYGRSNPRIVHVEVALRGDARSRTARTQASFTTTPSRRRHGERGEGVTCIAHPPSPTRHDFIGVPKFCCSRELRRRLSQPSACPPGSHSVAMPWTAHTALDSKKHVRVCARLACRVSTRGH